MSNVDPAGFFGHNTDTNGLENLFDVTVSSATDDTAQRKTIEVSIAEAAKRLGTSERTVWRRIDRGELKSRTKGNKRLVKIPVVSPDVTVDSDGHMTLHDTPGKASALVDLQALLRDLQSANYRVGYLEAQLEAHREQIKLLPDLQARATQAAEQEQIIKQLREVETELANYKRSWWYRLWHYFFGYRYS